MIKSDKYGVSTTPVGGQELSELVWIDVNRIFKAGKIWKILSFRLKEYLICSYFIVRKELFERSFWLFVL